MLQCLRKQGKAGHANETELVSGSGQKGHLPGSIPARIESEIPASENDLISTVPLGNRHDDSGLSEGANPGRGSEEEDDEESAALLGSREVCIVLLETKNSTSITHYVL